ncbi:hypothetical protein F528_2606, partial [Neisseria meningitidis 992008]
SRFRGNDDISVSAPTGLDSRLRGNDGKEVDFPRDSG